MILLTEREAQQLIRHLGTQPDWKRLGEEYSWAWAPSGEPRLAIALNAVPEEPDFVGVAVTPLSASKSESELLLEQIVRYSTVYGFRKRVEAFLAEDLLFPDCAEAASRDIEDLLLVGEPTAPPSVPQRSTRTNGEVGLFHLVGGGYLHLELIQGMFQATISVPNGHGGPLAFGPVLEGSVRPYDRRVLDVAAAIAGWETK